MFLYISNPKTLEHRLRLYRALELPITADMTAQTTTIKAGDDTIIFSPSAIRPKDLHFIKEVREDVEKNIHSGIPAQALEITGGVVNFSARDAKYFKYYVPFRDRVYVDAVELDVNKAYWTIARQMGYLSEGVYNKGLTVGKMARLAALGSLAVTKDYFQWDYEVNDFVKRKPQKHDEELASVFFSICFVLGERMAAAVEAIGRDNVMFYWVDAFFCRAAYVDELRDEMATAALECKTVELETITVKKSTRYPEAWTIKIIDKNPSPKTGKQRRRLFWLAEPKGKKVTQKDTLNVTFDD